MMNNFSVVHSLQAPAIKLPLTFRRMLHLMSNSLVASFYIYILNRLNRGFLLVIFVNHF